MIYRRPSLSRPQFVFSVVVASTGAILGEGACTDTTGQPSGADAATDATDDVTEDVQYSSSGSGSGSSGGSSTSSGVCVTPSSGSSSGNCNLILYDATSDAIENLDTGPDQEAAASDGSSDGTAETGNP
jgi:hypothetical protein